MYSERIQILLSPDQRQRLEEEAERRKSSVASLVREAIDARFGVVSREDRVRAVEEIRAMQGGRFLSPEELNRLSAGEREDELDEVLRSVKR